MKVEDIVEKLIEKLKESRDFTTNYGKEQMEFFKLMRGRRVAMLENARKQDEVLCSHCGSEIEIDFGRAYDEDRLRIGYFCKEKCEKSSKPMLEVILFE